MPWECVSCHRSIRLYPDPRGCDDESICWHCLYEQREELLAACEEALPALSAENRWPEEAELCRKAIAKAKGETA